MSLSHRRVTSQNLAKLVESFLDMYVKTINVIVFSSSPKLVIYFYTFYEHVVGFLSIFLRNLFASKFVRPPKR